MKFKKNVRKSPIILLKSGQTVTMDTRLYNHKNETRLKDYSNKGKGKTGPWYPTTAKTKMANGRL